MKNVQKSTIITRFIQDKIEGYVEPSKKGVPKGEQIGLSRKKYYASLFMLTNYPLEEIAKVVGVSHGLLRKWRTERAFQETIQNHCQELSIMIANFLVGRWKDRENKAGIKMAKTVEKVGVTDYETYREHVGILRNVLPVKELADSNSYSPDLIACVLETVLNHKDELSGKSLFGILNAIFFNKSTEAAQQKIRRSIKKVLPYLLESAKDILSKDKITDGERLALFGIIDTAKAFVQS